MRRSISLVVVVSAAVGAAQLWGCSSSSSSDDTCAFAKDSNNCWHKLAKTIDDCLTDDSGPEAGPRPRGQMSADGTTCTYATGRNVTFALDPRVSSGSGSNEPDRDFTVTVGGKTCIHYVRNKSGLSITGPGGTVSEGSNGNLTCPDGSTHGIGLAVTNCLDAAFAGGLPGSFTTNTSSSWYFELLGTTKPAYDCSNTLTP